MKNEYLDYLNNKIHNTEIRFEDIYYIRIPLMLGDVLEYLSSKCRNEIEYDYFIKIIFPNIFEKWKDPNLPLRSQSEQCIENVYNIVYNIDKMLKHNFNSRQQNE